ncbi:hypothetical protein ACQ4PT_068301 [Festuca glaucescens]
MEKGQAEKGKGKEAASEETKWAAPSAAGAAADLSSSRGPSRFGSAVAAPAKKKRAYETEAQIRRRKKKNRKNRERQERKAAGLKINSPDDVPTFDESDSDDRSELRVLPNWRKRPIIRGPGIEEEYDFEAFIEYANRVKMSYDDFDALERLVAKYLPTISLYVCTIKKSNIVKNKAKMYFSRRFTINHILPNIQLPATIKVYSRNANVAHVKMVMNMSTVKGIPKGGAMITSNWMDVVRQNGMKINQNTCSGSILTKEEMVV